VNSDQILRVVLIVVLLVVLPVGIYHRVKSESTREPLDRRREGLFMLATLRPVGALFWLALLAWMIDPGWMRWSSLSLPLWSRWTGVAVIVVACGLLMWTFRSLGMNLTDTVVTRRNHSLVSDGPYRWIRHPFYASAALIMLAIVLITANWFFLATGVLVFSLLVIRTRTEEAHLVARFGERYRTYMKHTGRFVPRIGRWSSGRIGRGV
jgi:protein-S-isoprenylcysteine O-methyltransferase Ste14